MLPRLGPLLTNETEALLKDPRSDLYKALLLLVRREAAKQITEQEMDVMFYIDKQIEAKREEEKHLIEQQAAAEKAREISPGIEAIKRMTPAGLAQILDKLPNPIAEYLQTISDLNTQIAQTNAAISAHNGEWREAQSLAQQQITDGMVANNITFIGADGMEIDPTSELGRELAGDMASMASPAEITRYVLGPQIAQLQNQYADPANPGVHAQTLTEKIDETCKDFADTFQRGRPLMVILNYPKIVCARLGVDLDDLPYDQQKNLRKIVITMDAQGLGQVLEAIISQQTHLYQSGVQLGAKLCLEKAQLANVQIQFKSAMPAANSVEDSNSNQANPTSSKPR